MKFCPIWNVLLKLKVYTIPRGFATIGISPALVTSKDFALTIADDSAVFTG